MVFGPGNFWMSVTILSGVVLGSLDTYVVNTGMPKVLAELGQPIFYSWVTSAFLLSQIVGLSIGGAWQDRSGLRTPFMISVAVFAVGSFCCAFVPSMSALVAARAFQGLGGGGVLAVCFAGAARYPEALRLRMYSLVPTAWGVVSLVAPLLGGILTDTVGWRWIFLLNAPLCAGVVALAIRGFAGASTGDRGRSLPVVRSVLLAVTVGALTAAPSAPLPVATLLLIAGAGVGWMYLSQERKAAVPVIPVGTWRGSGPVGSSLLAAMLFAAAFSGATVFVPLYLQRLRDESATKAGIVLTIGGLCWMVGSVFSTGHARGPWPMRTVVGGALFVAAGALGVVIQIGIGTAPLALLYLTWGLAAAGIGMGLLHVTNWAVVFSSPALAGTASSAVQTLRLVGAAASGAIMGALLNGLGADQAHLRTSLMAVFAFAAIIAFSLATVLRPRIPARPELELPEGAALAAVEA